MKIVLIGPVYPYKGGIAHYTSLLCKALRAEHEVEMISYRMQYPRILYKKEQKDYSNEGFRVEKTKYWLHTANPFNMIACAMKIRKMKPDAVLLQWWHPYFAPCYILLCRLLGRIPVLFTCHNVFPHERFPMDRLLTKWVLRQGDGFIVQSGMDEADLLSIKPQARHVVTPHPTYNAFKMQNMSRQTARELLHVEEQTPMLLFFGFVREYKGLQYLLDAMKQLREYRSDIRLWVVGDFGEDKGQYLNRIAQNGIGECVQLVEGYIPDQEVEKYFAASDLVVLPYVSATQSGIVQIAYGFEKPVVVTKVGGLPDVVEDRRTGYVVPERDPQAIASAVKAFYEDAGRTDWTGNIRKKAEEFSWDRMVRQIDTLLPR